MITPIEIQSKTFKSGGLGYDKKDVDGFLRDVLRSYEQIYRENMELNDKVAVLSEGIQYYKTIEKTLQKALVLAEKTAEDTKTAALEKAKAIEKEANTRSQLIVADAKNELEHIHSQTVQLIQQYEKYKQQFKHLAQAQMELIESESFNINVARLDAFIDVKQVSGNGYTDVRNTDNPNVDKKRSENKHADHKRSENKHRENKHYDPKHSKYANQEEFQVEMEPSLFEALDQVSATNEDVDRSYGNGNHYAKEDEEDYPYDQKNDLENQDEFSFINLVDEED